MVDDNPPDATPEVLEEFIGSCSPQLRMILFGRRIWGLVVGGAGGYLSRAHYEFKIAVMDADLFASAGVDRSLVESLLQ